uniref:helix-turn-helix domain-containing protein n=1 Tax=Roseibium sp. TaxID=1936156 RepID=UPI003D0CFCA2
ATETDISQRHLSFLESGRSRPSRDMVMHLTEFLDVPLRERNAILTAAGFAPHYPQHELKAPELSAANAVIERILQGHLPHPALAVNRHWELLAANKAVFAMLDGIAPHLLEGTVNVLRLSLHPEGLAPRILNLAEWRTHILARLAHEIDRSADPALAALRNELEAFPVENGTGTRSAADPVDNRIAVPLRFKGPSGPLNFLSTTTVFGTAVDVTLSEIAIEAFFPEDEETAQTMSALAARKA